MPSPPSTSATKTEISSERLWLRAYTQEMAHDFWELLHQNRARLMLDFPDRTSAVLTLSDAQNRIKAFSAQFQLGDLYSFGIWRKEQEDYIGDMTLRRLARGKPYAEVGYYLGDQAQGQGYATEALKAVARYAFEVLQMEHVDLRCAEGNDRSRRVAERTGFTFIKTFTPTGQSADASQNRPIHLYRLKKHDLPTQPL